jgi:molecular chaperone HscB
MNYFELYGLPVLMKVDMNEVKKKFYELSRKYHPDFFANASDEEQADVLEKSSLINKAYKTFQNPDETIRYVLQMHNLIEEEEKYNLDPSFLMEVMEINEQLMDAEMEEDSGTLNSIKQEADDLLIKIYSDVAKIVEHYQEGITTEKELLQVKDYYYRKKYLQRILDKIAQMRNIASP